MAGFQARHGDRRRYCLSAALTFTAKQKCRKHSPPFSTWNACRGVCFRSASSAKPRRPLAVSANWLVLIAPEFFCSKVEHDASNRGSSCDRFCLMVSSSVYYSGVAVEGIVEVTKWVDQDQIALMRPLSPRPCGRRTTMRKGRAATVGKHCRGPNLWIVSTLHSAKACCTPAVRTRQLIFGNLYLRHKDTPGGRFEVVVLRLCNGSRTRVRYQNTLSQANEPRQFVRARRSL